MTRGEWLRWERQGEDICVCRDDRKKDRYGVRGGRAETGNEDRNRNET